MPSTRRFLTGLAALAVCGGSLVVAPEVASANSCNTVAVGDWSNNCTASEGDASHMVEVVQMMVQGQELCAGNITRVDGIFGPMTYNGVVCYQKFFGLAQDGTVGPKTWGSMEHSLAKCHASGGWQYWSTLSGGCAAPNIEDWINTGHWYLLSPISRQWRRMDTGAPS
jgi:hypothetical protein